MFLSKEECTNEQSYTPYYIIFFFRLLQVSSFNGKMNALNEVCDYFYLDSQFRLGGKCLAGLYGYRRKCGNCYQA